MTGTYARFTPRLTMANQAQVTSVEAIEAFRANLIIFAAKARRALDDAGEEVRRTRNWLQHDQRSRWETEVRKRGKVLEQAEQDLINVRLNQNSETALQARQIAVGKAKRAVEEAEAKVRLVRKWSQNFDHQLDPHVKRLEGIAQFINQDIPKGIAHLALTVRLLDDYAESAKPGAKSAPASPEPPHEAASP